MWFSFQNPAYNGVVHGQQKNSIDLEETMMSNFVRAMRNPEFRSTVEGFNHPAGAVNEEELKQLAGAGDVNTETTPSSFPCIGITVTLSVNFCPTSACSNDC